MALTNVPCTTALADDLKRNDHVTTICNKANKQLNFQKKLKNQVFYE
jgi:hypothetical protein